jgi:molybdopterin-guanine dinucleotide biosynthesis protein B
LQQCDLVLIEGFKQGGFPKLEVWRDIQNKNTLWPKLLDITAIASDRNIPLVEIPQFLLEDIEGIANFILANAMLFNKSTDPVLAQGDLNFD